MQKKTGNIIASPASEAENNAGKQYLFMDVISGSTVISRQVERFRSKPRTAQISTESPLADERELGRLSELDDAALVRECLLGRLTAFDQLVLRYRQKVLRLVLSVLGSNAEVEDVVQEIFIKVYLSIERFRGDASFSTYLYTATVNRCRDELRKMKLRKFFSFDDWLARDGAEHPSGENGEQMEMSERRVAVQRAMKRLPTQTQMLLYLREIEELSYKELADIFEVEIGTIKSRLARGRDRLREELLPYIKEGTMPESDDER